jgi:tetratricopeptide (TPR) repeat protein
MKTDLAEQETLPSHLLVLPDAPADLVGPVKAWRAPVTIWTYRPETPNKNPMFLEKRVYQGSSGRVYPLPFIDRISTEPEDREWDAIHIENEYLRLMILPEIGGRIHIGFDKISGYDFFYRQNVIKPALVGLAGPWISGGIEFNWPQHHRPATFMPVETEIKEDPDGSVTIWCSDHDPMLHMKGMHGVCLRPGYVALEVKVRLFNRTQLTQSFLWWANVAARVHERYQSFFPPDVSFVADHAKRAITSFPLSDRPYYGVDYPARARNGVPEEEQPAAYRPHGSYPANDLSWYANIPVPTSYMITRSNGDFFGGYDHSAQAGFVHVANHHIAPGKKQWTWGNHAFGYAWDRSLTDADGPYVELMAGVYTDNQPDFSYLAPWETKTFVQTWYPIRKLGVPQAANTEAALRLETVGSHVTLSVGVTRNLPDATVQLLRNGIVHEQWRTPLSVTNGFVREITLPAGIDSAQLSVTILARGRKILAFDPSSIDPGEPPVVATEPLTPEQIATVEELYLTGVHLEQNRHATRRPELYWLEALKRDPQESRVLNALGLWHMRRGELPQAVEHFDRAIRRATRLNPNPYDGEPYYNLGIALRFLGQTERAYDALYKATWNAAWRGPAYFALAEIDASRKGWQDAEDHLQRALRVGADNLNARNLLGFVYAQQGRANEAEALYRETLELDPFDGGARWALGVAPRNAQETLDLAFDLLRAGRQAETIDLFEAAQHCAENGTLPMILFTLADIQREGGGADAASTLDRAAAQSKDYCFPSRIEEMLVLERVLENHPRQALASYLLGNFLYDRRRYDEAIDRWESAAALQPEWATVWRNLGIAYFNVGRDSSAALAAFDRAFELDTSDGRVLYERDQLWKRTGRSPELRMRVLLAYPDLVKQRDDLSVELATLYNQMGLPRQALDLLRTRHFQPWEGGEGLVLGQYVRSRLLIGRDAFEDGNAKLALEHFFAALTPPSNLSEAKHLLANQNDAYFWIGRAYEALGDTSAAETWYLRAVRRKGDFQRMCVRDISEMSYWSAAAMGRLGMHDEAALLFEQILVYAQTLVQTAPGIDYFATSLSTMLLFEGDPEAGNRTEAAFLQAQALLGLGKTREAEALLRRILKEDGNHAGAHDLFDQLSVEEKRVESR